MGEKVICQYCNKPAILKTSEEFYGKDYGTNVWVCFNCDSFVGTHGRSNIPKGSLANRQLRKKRMQAHYYFDQLWRGENRRMSRDKAYRWMQKEMNLSKEKAHIGMFDELQCIILILKVRRCFHL